MKAIHHTLVAVYIAFALLAAGVSYTLEAIVAASLMAMPILAKLLVLVLEGAKIGLIFMGHIGHFFEGRFRFFQSSFAFGLRFMLLFLSAFATFFLLSNSLYLPHEQAARAQDRQQALVAFEEVKTGIQREAEAQATVIREGFRQRQQAIQAELDLHTADIRREVDNPINGVVVGVRYEAFERNRDNAEQTLGASLSQESALLSSIDADRAVRLAEARRHRDAELQRIATAGLEDDPRAHNPYLWNFTATVSTVTGHDVSRTVFIFLFGLLVAVALEGAIVHFTRHVAAFSAPQLKAYRQYLQDMLGAFAATTAGLADESSRFQRIAAVIRNKTREAFHDFDRMMRSLLANSPVFRKRPTSQSEHFQPGPRPSQTTPEPRFRFRPRKSNSSVEDDEENTHA